MKSLQELGELLIAKGLRQAATPFETVEVNAKELAELKFTEDKNDKAPWSCFANNVRIRCNQEVRIAILTSTTATIGLYKFENDKKETILYARIDAVA